MKKFRWLERSLAFLLACLLCFSSLNVLALAADATNIYRRLNIFEGKTLNVFGKTHNSMGYYQEGLAADAMPTLCLEPGRRMPNGTQATYQMYTATSDESIPGVGDSDKFVPITLAYEWLQSGIMRDKVRYAVVQVYIWGCVAGYAEDWSAQEEAQTKLAEVLNDNRVMSEYENMKTFIEAGLDEFNGAANSSLPGWNGTKQKMILEDGSYVLTLDISACPQLKNVVWSFPDSNWSYQMLGESIKFLYYGAGEPQGEVKSSELTGVGNATKFYAYIFTPGTESDYQRQVGRFSNDEIPTYVTFTVNQGVGVEPGTVTFETYRHSEPFESNYNIDLEKYCAETDQRLEGTTFNIWEDFDRGQLSGHKYEEGSPDGRSGCLYNNGFSPLPSGRHICDTITTDANGYAAHRDARSYNYSKTYCTGHPAPEWVEVPEEEYDELMGECSNEGEIEAAEAENQRLMDLWISQQEMCEDTCDFHVGNADEENRDLDYSAQEEMLADRDETYENFINLEYSYELEEKTARTGYVLHGVHRDDSDIEAVTVSSAQAGGNARRAPSQKILTEPRKIEGFTLVPLTNRLIRQITFNVKSPNLELDDLRKVEDVRRQTTVDRATSSEASSGTGKAADYTTASNSEAEWIYFENADGWDEEDSGEEDSEDEVIPGYYRYTWKSIEQPEVKIASASMPGILNGQNTEASPSESWGPAFFSRAAAFFTGTYSDDVEINDKFPDFVDDDLDSIGTGGYGAAGEILYTFKVWDHRTEGEVHINKRDLELYKADPDNSYGQSQGDGTLEGAVYGLFASQDLLHPDGKTGMVYSQNDLVAVAATDQHGDASFLAFTEKPGTRLDGEGNINPPEAATGPENLYNGSAITSSNLGFGVITYPNYTLENGSQWIGRPLLLGSYYVMELSRSEGYELSVHGISGAESNRNIEGITTVREAGKAEISAGLSDNNNMDADGSWNDFTVQSYKTKDGYDVVVTGYPKNTTFYQMSVESVSETLQTITGSSLQPKKDEAGNVIYQKAQGGEFKTDENGSPIVKEASDETKPQAETVRYRFRLSGYPKGDVEPENIDRWQEPVGDYEYLREEINGMLKMAGYKEIAEEDGAPWHNLELAGSINADAGTEILDWFVLHNAWDSGTVQSIYEENGAVFARLYYDYSKADENYPAFYDALNQALYIRKSMNVDSGPQDSHYWIGYEKGGFSLGAQTASVKLKREIPAEAAVIFGEELEGLIQGVYQPSYETYAPGETLLGPDGQPVPVTERVYTYADYTQEVDRETREPVTASYDTGTGNYTVHMENETDWDNRTEPEYTRFRAVTARTTIEHEGETMYYNQYLVEKAGAGVSAYAAAAEFEAGSYIVSQRLVYPGQFMVFQDGGTRDMPLQVLERIIKQPIRITKDISQASYDDVNTYGSIHNDPLTVFLGLFNGGASSQGTKLLNQFKFKAYLKTNLEAIYIDHEGNIISEECWNPDFKGDVQRVFIPPENGGGTQLLERNEDGTYNYKKFFDALYAVELRHGINDDFISEKFAAEYYDIAARKKSVLAENPGLNSDLAYARAMEQVKQEADAYLDIFEGLDRKLAIAWDRDAGGGSDGDKTTLQCNTKNGKDDYYNSSIMVPYGTYVIAEQTAADADRELANRHYHKDFPKEVVVPFAPDISADGNTGEETVNSDYGNPYYFYRAADTPEDLVRKYKIRFNEETHIIQAHRNDGDFVIYKYGLKPGAEAGDITGAISRSEYGGTMDGVIYNGNETDSGEMEIRDGVATMTGVSTAIDGKYAAMLVPWTILEPAADRINPDTGNVETLIPSGSGKDFNFVAYATEDFENKYYSSKLRIEKLDAETGENIIHTGALFKIYAAKRDVEKAGVNAVSGSGKVLFGEAVDADGSVVRDNMGNKVLYPRVGASNSSTDDLPVRLDQNRIPMYDESQLIMQEDRDGNETGIFKAYSTVREVVADGQIRKETVGYIETYKPLGAGAYVLVEIQAPEGYTKSRPVAFEVYADGAGYYGEQRRPDGTTDGWKRIPAMQYQVAVPVTGETNKFRTETVSQIIVQDYPSRIKIYKVEDGDSLVGNVNGLEITDQQGQTEASGGFDKKVVVNDAGDLLTYQVRGRKEYLEERGDVRDITYDPETQEWVGSVTKAFDMYSEEIVEGTENQLKAMEHVKLLYQLDGTFTGKGIRFKTSVSDAVLALYRGIELERTADHVYTGVTAVYENGKVTEIRNTNTGTRKEICIAGKDSGPAGLDIWDSMDVDNDPVNLFFYDLTGTDKQENVETGELEILDPRGNVVCYADSETGMAYVYDDYGRIIAYTVDEKGRKELVRQVQVSQNGGAETLYPGKASVDDENGLPIYYEQFQTVLKDERWTTDSSFAPDGEPETAGAAHEITRLPFGAYILQEEGVPYDQGYIQSKYIGLLLEDTEETQKYFLQDVFTKTAFAKIDVRTQREIQGASMTLYRARLDEDGQALRDERGNYVKGERYAGWISGTLYDDRGNQQLAAGDPISTTEPHWIDHIPAGPYVLEETVCPYEQGYVQSASASIDVLETGNVQTFVMEDDFTSIDIRKYDTKNKDVMYQDSEAYLSLYVAWVDETGTPMMDENGGPVYDPDDEIMTFRAATYRDGQEVADTGRLEPDAAGSNPIMKYDYTFSPIPNTAQGRFYYTEYGTVRLEYLPSGYYVLVETENPDGYATAPPQIMEVKDRGHLEEIQKAGMGDQPLRAEISKVNVTGGKEVSGARLAVYPVGAEGIAADRPLVIRRPAEEGQYENVTAEWVSGSDGAYTAQDKTEGNIPPGFDVGDLKPHVIDYIPEGDYILVETITPYGFLQSVEIPFTIRDTKEVQRVEMMDEIPGGVLKIVKHDEDEPDMKLAGAVFKLFNQTLGQDCETVVTDIRGEARFAEQPIGYMDAGGHFAPYTYVCEEIQPAPGYMLTLKPYEFQFLYVDDQTSVVYSDYNPANDSNRVKVDKVIGDTEEMLEGARLQIERQMEEEPDQGAWEIVDSWVSTLQTHYSRGLKAGQYRLVELETPGEGYKLLAEPIEFTINDGMTQIPYLVMRNYTSAVEVEKTVGTSGRPLAGARLQLIRKADESIIDEWTSQDTGGRLFYGLAAGTYVIRELEAPSGYRRAADLEIQVEAADHETQVFCYANYIKGSSGGDTPEKPRTDYVTFSKVDMDHRPVHGAEFTFYHQDGTVMGTSVSDYRGVFRIRKPENGTYIFRETKVPEGYTASQEVYSFTVSSGQVAEGIYEVVNHRLVVEIKKLDGITGQGLPGARLRILSLPEGDSVYEGVTGEDGRMTFCPPGPGDYEIKELETPEGYVRSDTACLFTVAENGAVTGNTTVYNFKAEKKIGRITVFYKAGKLDGGAFWDVPGSGWPELVKTGDYTPLSLILLGLTVSLLGLTVCLWRKWGRKMLLIPAVLLLGLGLFCSTAEAGVYVDIRAQAAGSDTYQEFPEFRMVGGSEYRLKEVVQEQVQEEQVQVPAEEQAYYGTMSPPFTDSPEHHIPESRILHDGQAYALAAYETVPARISGRTVDISHRVVYRNMESGESIPSTAAAVAVDPVTGSRHRVMLPLQSQFLENERWVNGFKLEAEAEACDGEMFLLGNSLFKLDNGNLPPDIGENLLAEAGLGTSEYEIHDIRWRGKAYEREGVICRGLLAVGRKKVADRTAIYGGEAALEDIDGQAVQAVYVAEQTSGSQPPGQRPLICKKAYYVKCLSIQEKKAAAITGLAAVLLLAITCAAYRHVHSGKRGRKK